MDFTVSIETWEQKALSTVMIDIQEWTEYAVKERARIASENIISLLIAHCNEKEIQLAVGKEAQIQQAIDLGVVQIASSGVRPVDQP